MAQRLASLAITYPASRTRVKSPLAMRIRQNQFMHDVASVRYDNVSSNNPIFRTGSPIRIAYGYQHERQAEFLGYVLWAKNKRSLKDKNNTYLDLTCIGASRLMQQPAHRVHNNLTAAQIVRGVAREHDFDVLRGHLSERWPRVVNTGKSDFQFLMAIAAKHGHTFYVHNTTVCMYDPVAYTVKHKNAWPRLRNEPGSVIDNITDYEGSIGDGGDLFENTGVQRMFTMDQSTNEILQVADTGDCTPHMDDIFETPPFDRYLYDPASSLQEANQLVAGAAAANRWKHHMRTASYGDQRIHQGTGVVLLGMNPDCDGLWYVNSTEHFVSREAHPQQFRYSMELNLWRDSRTFKAVPIPTTSKPERRHDDPVPPCCDTCGGTGSTGGPTGPRSPSSSTGLVYGAAVPATGSLLKHGHWVTNHPRREVLAA